MKNIKEKQEFGVSLEHGLTQEQVKLRYDQGKYNKLPEPSTKSTKDILKDNICTRFNLYNLLIALALVFVGAWSNIAFFLIIVLNALIGIMQELRAKKLIEELSILSAPQVLVIRDGQFQEIETGGLVQDDIMILESGMQICADAMVERGRIEVNEALLTGESDPILKETGDILLSGSSVISGQCRASVIHVGEANYVAGITKEAGKFKKIHSELLDSMRRVTRFTGYLIPPLGMILFIQAFFYERSRHLAFCDNNGCGIAWNASKRAGTFDQYKPGSGGGNVVKEKSAGSGTIRSGNSGTRRYSLPGQDRNHYPGKDAGHVHQRAGDGTTVLNGSSGRLCNSIR